MDRDPDWGRLKVFLGRHMPIVLKCIAIKMTAPVIKWLAKMCYLFEKISEESMKKSKLERQLIINYAGCANIPIEFYERKLLLIKSQKAVMAAFTGVNKSTVYSSYVAFYHIVKKKLPQGMTKNDQNVVNAR